ncbi:MAG: hypothetical protein H7Y17_07950 [Chlorobia bacterium]|nr:hypothetical protein [Fimbriimonadaceae bacterium]
MQRGAAFVASFVLMSLVAVGTVTYVNHATGQYRSSKRQTFDAQTTHLCEAGVQSVLRQLWRPFKASQKFDDLDDETQGSSKDTPTVNLAGTIPGVGRFSAGVVGQYAPNGSTYQRIITVRAVGWVDRDADGQLDNDEPQKVVDVMATYELARSQVFDYTYFVNNYGWMTGFSQNDLIINGDMRANGNFDFSGGTPTINGSIYASNNEKLSPPAAGLINAPPVKWSNGTYAVNNALNPRARQAYTSGVFGAKGSAQYDTWRDFGFDSIGGITNNKIGGAVLGDTNGVKSWDRQTVGTTPTPTTLDPNPTQEVIMPDLSDISHYTALSAAYTNQKQYYGDGTANPNYGQSAKVEVWDQSLNSGAGAYKRIDTNGVVNGSAALIGTSAKPIKIHGPVTFTQDCVIKGYVEGQGTIYTGRNVHVVGSIRYKNPPDFRGSDLQAIDNANEKKDMIALAARGSVMLGNPKDFRTPYPLTYMTPPFTKGHYDDNGNWIPPFDAMQVDGTGFKKYQSTMGDNYLDSIDESVNQIDAILYTNFVGGGDVGTGGGGVQFNGSIISKDEAMVVFSLPMYMNYDNRIREKGINKQPLIDLQLPRSPVMLRSAWQDRGFSFYSGI